MEVVDTCPLCKRSESEFLFWNFDRRYRLPGKFGTISCRGCGLVRISPRPTVESIGLYYPDDYGAYEGSPYTMETMRPGDRFGLRDAVRSSVLAHLGYFGDDIKIWQKALGPMFTRIFNKKATYGFTSFPRFVKDGRALEVGCGNGRFLSYLKHHGWNVQGIDLSPYAKDRAKELFDIDVFLGQVEDAPFENDTFDYIHLSHVVEHFFDPVSSMQKIKDLLKPGGTVYVEVPNADAISAQISGEYWYGWDAPRHLFTFSQSTLTRMLTDIGLSITKTETTMWDSFDWAMTYLYEEKAGEALEIRPMIRDKDKATVDQDRREARRRFSRRPDDGDFISYWAIKPA